jgi:hypothetical protein
MVLRKTATNLSQDNGCPGRGFILGYPENEAGGHPLCAAYIGHSPSCHYLYLAGVGPQVMCLQDLESEVL